MAPMKTLLLLFVCIIFFLTLFQGSKSDDLEEDVAFFESQETDDMQQSHQNYEINFLDPHNSANLQHPSIDEKDVIVLNKENMSEFVEKNKNVLVEFYAPWCWHCQALTAEYAAAATELKGEVMVAKVDGTQELELLQKYNIEGFPTLLLFVEGIHKGYEGERTKDGIVTWVKKKTGLSVYSLTTTEVAESVLAAKSAVVLGFVDFLVGTESEELVAASKLRDDVKFYQTSNPDVAKLFHIESVDKGPALVLLKDEDEKLSYFDGPFSKLAIAEFVSNNKLPLVVTLTRESAVLVFDTPIKKLLLLFATSDDSENIKPTFQEAAKYFKEKLTFVYVETDHQDTEKPVLDYFGVIGDTPRVLAFRNDDEKKYLMNGNLTLSNIKSFAEDFMEDKLQPFFKSDPISENNDGDVKIVVGKNFDEIILDESKDVLLEADGFPTLLFFPAGNKSFMPINVGNDRTVVAFYKFLREHSSIPFKLQKPAAPDSADNQKISNDMNLKDEL